MGNEESHLPLQGLTVIEVSAFVAAPLAGLLLAQLGADVVRVDPTGGGIDHSRWPVSEQGASLYWAGLNRGKESVWLDTRGERGRRLLLDVVAAPSSSGIVLTNVSPRWLSYEALQAVRPDVILVEIGGRADGGPAVDYTVNAATGFPLVTGDSPGPVNHVLPAWDVAAGCLAALGMVSAERRRAATGRGSHVRLALSDVAVAVAGYLGLLAEAEINRSVRAADGNHLYGAFGRDFALADGRRMMVVALTPRQWEALMAATDSVAAMTGLEERLGVDLRADGERYRARRAIASVLEPWFAARTSAEVAQALDRERVVWGPYQSFADVVADPAADHPGSILHTVEDPVVGRHLVPGGPLRFDGAAPQAPPAPLPGQDGPAALARLLGLSEQQIADLLRSGVLGQVPP